MPVDVAQTCWKSCAKPKVGMGGSCWQLTSKGQQPSVPGLRNFFLAKVCSPPGAASISWAWSRLINLGGDSAQD